MKLDTGFADAHKMFPDTGIVLAAVSGGADSMCLLRWLFTLAPERGFELACAHFNHGLRGEKAEEDGRFVARFCSDRGIPFYLGAGDTANYAKSQRQSIEEAARNLRYAFLYETAEKIGAIRIATAHTADDNAETVLANLIRGTGTAGLGGIPPVRGNIIRPMLQMTRKTVEGYLQAAGISHVEDETNREMYFTRNKLRHRAIPVCKEINSRFLESVMNTVRLVREDNAYLESEAEKFPWTISGDSLYANAADLCALPRPIGSRAVRRMLFAATGQMNISTSHIDGVFHLAGSVDPSAEICLPGGVSVFREYESLVIKRGLPDSQSFSPRALSGGITDILEIDLRFCMKVEENALKIHNSFNYFSFKYDSICGTITVRPRKPGDEVVLHHRAGTRKLKKLFIDAKIPQKRRNQIPVLEDELGIIAVCGFGISERCRPDVGDHIIKVSVEEIGHGT